VSARRWLPGLVTALALAACGADGPGEGAAPVREQRFVEYDDVRIEVLAEGIGMPVVLLPSLGRDSYDYDEIAEGLAADGFRVLRPIPRGMGGSSGPMQDLTLHDFARDVAAVVEHEGAGPAVLVGHAYGHFVARMTAADRPDLVRGVVCAACAARAYPDSLSKLVVVAADPQRPEAERLDALRAAFFAPGNDPTDAFQCGFCTSGQIMSAVAVVTEGNTGSDAIRESMCGNICRCGAYPNIVEAIKTGSGRGRPG
jgi:pimeloyl-ACP methyl ester carboxylesterase